MNERLRFSFLRHQKKTNASSSPQDAPSPTPQTTRRPQQDAEGGGAQIPSTNEETTELLKTTNHIRTQLHEAQRLRLLKEPLLNAPERNWLDSTIDDIADVLRDVDILMEPTRVEREVRNGKLSLGGQLRWMYRDSRRARDKTNRLLACHHSLMMVLNHLQRLDLPDHTIPTVHELGADPQLEAAMHSQSDLQRLGFGSVEPPDGKADPTVSGYMADEMSDMLSWRQSKGASVQMNRPLG